MIRGIIPACAACLLDQDIRVPAVTVWQGTAFCEEHLRAAHAGFEAGRAAGATAVIIPRDDNVMAAGYCSDDVADQ